VNGIIVLIHLVQLDYIGVTTQVEHNLNLAGESSSDKLGIREISEIDERAFDKVSSTAISYSSLHIALMCERCQIL
jgi:hypothetical protein